MGHSHSHSHSSHSGRKKKRKIEFWPVMYVYMTLWVIVIGFICGKLWNFCREYQTNYEIAKYYSNPDLTMEGSLELYNEENILELADESFFEGVSTFENKENLDLQIKELVADKKLSFLRGENYSDKKPHYLVYADDTVIGEVYMKQIAQSDTYGFHLCEVTDALLVWSGFELKTIEITVPLNSSIKINNLEVSDDYLVSSEVSDSVISKKARQLAGKEFGTKTYKIDGFVVTPTVFVDGNEVAANDGNYMVEMPEDKLSEELSARILKANETYIKNMNLYVDFKAMSEYLIMNGDAYKNIESAQSGLAWSGKPDKLEIKSAEVVYSKYYSDSILVVTTRSSVYRLYREKEYDEEMNYEWLYTKDNGVWKISDFSYAK